MKKIDLNKLAKWDDGKPVNTRNGKRILHTAEATQDFWSMWREHKAELKDAGISCSKDRDTGEWKACWWKQDIDAAKSRVESRAAVADNFEFPTPDGLDAYAYQKAGVRYAMNHDSVMIADEMGLGKTIQAIGVINTDESIKRALIICPASLKLNWKKETSKWLTRELSIGIANGSDFPNTDIVIMNYDIAKKNFDATHAVEWDALILDEAHMIKNAKAQRTQAIVGKWDRDESKKIPAISARRKIVLTGTPIPNRPIEAFTILNYLAPSTFRGVISYGKKFCGGFQDRYGWDFNGSSNLDQLQDLLRETCMVRRLKADVLKELPAKTRSTISLDGFDSFVKREKEIIGDVDFNENDDDFSKVVRKSAGAAFEELSKLRHELAVAKTPEVIKHVDSTLEETDKVIVFAHHRDVVDMIMDHFGSKAVKVVGGMSNEAKNESVERFQNSDSVKVFVGNFIAAGVGLTLTASSTVIFAELDWVPGNVSQAEDRAHRIGQNDNVTVQYLVAEGSLDERMANVLAEKREVQEAALDAGSLETEKDRVKETIAKNVESIEVKANTDKKDNGRKPATVDLDSEVVPF